ncbi:Extracellular solute-binding protein, family 3 [Artemisia annua]|uniref:Extracellular solute-binding protein, family 3 n=1 Tax=Artemisia annua TaxID=35608 RepID=A0A2U1PX11_ARTAN|nr:Extracellular solute-binding protein, family 3 [Artemisia annua]
MELINHTVSFMLFVVMLCVYCLVDISNASIVTEEDRYSKLHVKSTSSPKRRSIKEQGDTGQADVCAGVETG